MIDTLIYIRRAVAADLPRLMEIFSAARAFMRSRGNFSQWTGGYPSPELVSDGISRGEQYAVCRRHAAPASSVHYEAASSSAPASASPVIPSERSDEGSPAEIVGTFWFVVGAEPTYARIFDGAWLSSQQPYGVVHRLASDGSAAGVGAMVLRWALARCGDVRVDTHRANSLMQSLLRREGFAHCGTIFLADGSPRDAFERILSPAEAKKIVREACDGNATEARIEAHTLGCAGVPDKSETSVSTPRAFFRRMPCGRMERGRASGRHSDKSPSQATVQEPIDGHVLSERLSSALTVALFCALPNEPSVDFLLDKWLTVKRLALPVVTSPPGSPPRMEFREYTGRECLRRGRFGILEPADTPLVPPGQIDVMLVPGVAYTVDGQRLGRGGGFYDRYLSAPAAAGIYKIGVCAPTALVEWLPMEEHDVVMNEIWILP